MMVFDLRTMIDQSTLSIGRPNVQGPLSEWLLDQSLIIEEHYQLFTLMLGPRLVFFFTADPN